MTTKVTIEARPAEPYGHVEIIHERGYSTPDIYHLAPGAKLDLHIYGDQKVSVVEKLGTLIQTPPEAVS